jgi:lipopolysaccharide transport system permease protein
LKKTNKTLLIILGSCLASGLTGWALQGAPSLGGQPDRSLSPWILVGVLLGLALFYFSLALILRWAGQDAHRLYLASGVRLNLVSVAWYRFLNPLGPLYSLYRHRDLLSQFTRREIEGRYKGSYLGMIWPLIIPLLLLGIYTFIFSVVFKVKWLGSGEINQGEFALTLFAGLIAFTVFSETITRSPSLIVSNPNYVKKVIFPLEILPVSVLGAALFQGFISVVILIAGELILLGTVSAKVFLLPLFMIPLAGFSLGLSWFLSSLGVYLRDIGYAIGIVVQILFFLSPIFYPIEAVPERFRIFIKLNPLTGILEGFRQVLVWNQWPDFGFCPFRRPAPSSFLSADTCGS